VNLAGLDALLILLAAVRQGWADQFFLKAAVICLVCCKSQMPPAVSRILNMEAASIACGRNRGDWTCSMNDCCFPKWK
jgi:hypothetical protein